MQHDTVEYFYIHATDRGGLALSEHGGVLTWLLTQASDAATTPLRDLFSDMQLPDNVRPVVWSRGSVNSLCLRCALQQPALCYTLYYTLCSSVGLILATIWPAPWCHGLLAKPSQVGNAARRNIVFVPMQRHTAGAHTGTCARVAQPANSVCALVL